MHQSQHTVKVTSKCSSIAKAIGRHINERLFVGQLLNTRQQEPGVHKFSHNNQTSTNSE